MRIGENLIKCVRCGLEYKQFLMFRLISGEFICRQCINDLYNLECQNVKDKQIK